MVYFTCFLRDHMFTKAAHAQQVNICSASQHMFSKSTHDVDMCTYHELSHCGGWWVWWTVQIPHCIICTFAGQPFLELGQHDDLDGCDTWL